MEREQVADHPPLSLLALLLLWIEDLTTAIGAAIGAGVM
jgi:hypothetical protein